MEVATELDVSEQFLGPSDFFFVIFIVYVHRNLGRILEKTLKACFARRQHLYSKGAFFKV